jgi:hypothetical protein
VGAVAGLFPWAGLADVCAAQGRPFVRGHALFMHALHGGKAKHETSEAHQIAALLRGGLLPPAAVSPAERRTARALHQRAAL